MYKFNVFIYDARGLLSSYEEKAESLEKAIEKVSESYKKGDFWVEPEGKFDEE